MFKRPKPIKPKAGQESVWDYPRPPIVQPSDKKIRIVFGGEVIAESTNARRVLETSHPPVYYLPQADVQMQFFSSTARESFCEFKGRAVYWTLFIGEHEAQNAAWSYPDPSSRFATIKDHIAVYPSLMDACYVDGEQVQAQAGDFYGGWITSDIVGPFKGEAGTRGW